MIICDNTLTPNTRTGPVPSSRWPSPTTRCRSSSSATTTGRRRSVPPCAAFPSSMLRSCCRALYPRLLGPRPAFLRLTLRRSRMFSMLFRCNIYIFFNMQCFLPCLLFWQNHPSNTPRVQINVDPDPTTIANGPPPAAPDFVLSGNQVHSNKYPKCMNSMWPSDLQRCSLWWNHKPHANHQHCAHSEHLLLFYS